MLDPVATGAEVPSFTGIQRQVDTLPRGEDLFDRAVSDRVHAHLESALWAAWKNSAIASSSWYSSPVSAPSS